MNRREGFTLLELMIVVGVAAIILAFAIPNILNARKTANEGSAIRSLHTLIAVSEQYRTRFGAYPPSLSPLETTGYIDSVLGSGTKSGYIFTYTGGVNLWECQANPELVGTTGDQWFLYVNDAGVIRFSTSGPATKSDPPLGSPGIGGGGGAGGAGGAGAGGGEGEEGEEGEENKND